jgi:hypothetical protein
VRHVPGGLSSRVSEARRVEWQGKIGVREEQAYGANARDIAAQLAIRFEAARQYDRGVKYFELAARNALAGNAYIEADRLYGKAIEMLPLAQLDDPAKAELRMLLPRSVAVIAHADTRPTRPRDPPARSPGARLRRSGGRGPCAAQRLDHVRQQGQLHRARFAISDLRPCRARPTRRRSAGACQARPDQLPSRRAHHGARLFRECVGDLGRHADEERPRVAGYLAWTLWYHRGLPRRRQPHGRRALRLGHTLKGHYGLVFGLGFACWIHSFRGELAEAEALVDEQFELSSEYGLPFWITWSSCLKGLIQSKRGNYEAGLARMQKSVIGYRATGALIGLVHFMTEFAETSLAAGDFARGLATIEEARAICARTGNRYHAADTHRVQGELLIANNRVEEGELRLLHALNVARSNGAKSLELRALTTLARRSPEWLMQLRDTRSAITEGGDTVDLRLADALLAASG